MAKSAPTPVDVLDFQFKLRCRLKVFQNNQNEVFSKACNIVAAASRYGLLFVGSCSPCFQVIQLQNLDKYSVKDGDISDYNRRTISLPSQPKHLAVNCDCTKLSVVVEKDGCVKAIIYDVTSFLKQTVSVVQEIRLSATPGVNVLETSWNPAVSTIFTVCKDDGSLGAYELKETGIEIHELPPAASATCMCWSPKGKQIAVGSRDGKITQYKPDLKVAKIINAPALEEVHYIVALQWISNYQFIGVFSNPNADSCLLVVDAPKTGEVTFTNYEDVCYSYSNTRPHQFYLLLQPTWNILMVASSNSMEVGVLGFENDHWTQWILSDSARAELPLSSTKQDTLPVGMTLDTSSTQQLPWGENTLEPMPLIVLLSHHGILCCFNAVNIKKGTVSLCKSPEQLQDTSGISQFTKTSDGTIGAVVPNKPIAINPMKQNMQQTTAVAPAFSFNQAESLQNVKPVGSKTASQLQISTSQTQSISPFRSSSASVVYPTPTLTKQSQAVLNPQPLLGNATQPLLKPDVQSSLNVKSSDSTSKIPFQNQSHAIKTSANEIKSASNTTSSMTLAEISAVQKPSQTQLTADITALNEDTEALIAQMVREECRMLEAELMALLHHGFELKVDLGTDSEATDMVLSSNALQDFVSQATETSSSQVAEVHSLKQSLMQTWMWYEEARSRFSAFKDPKLAALMHAQPLDPASEHQLSDIQHLFYYLESQLRQANVALDEQWENFQDSCKKRLSYRMPSLEAIYQAMVKQNATLQKQTYVLKDISNRARRKTRNNSVSHLLVSLDNASQLEEQLKSLHIQPKDVFHLQYEKLLSRQKLLTKNKSDKLANLLLRRKVVHVSVTKPQLSTSSVQLSALMGVPLSPIVSNKKLQPQKLEFVQSTPKASAVFTKPEPIAVTGTTAPLFAIPPNKIQPISSATPTATSLMSSETPKSQSNLSFAVSKPLSATSASLWNPNVNVFGSGDIKNSPGSAFVPTTQNIQFGVKSSSNLFSNTSSQITTPSSSPAIKITPKTKSTSLTGASTAEQKSTFSFITPVSVVSTTAAAKMVATTTSTSIFNTPVLSSATDTAKPFSFPSKPSASLSSSTFSFQTLPAGTNANTASPFSTFNFSAPQNSSSQSASTATLIKPITGSVFGSPSVSTSAVARSVITAVSSTTQSSGISEKVATITTEPAKFKFDFPTATSTSTPNVTPTTISSATVTTIKSAPPALSSAIPQTSVFGSTTKNSLPNSSISTAQSNPVFGNSALPVEAQIFGARNSSATSTSSVFGTPTSNTILQIPTVARVSASTSVSNTNSKTPISVIDNSSNAPQVSLVSSTAALITSASTPSIFSLPVSLSEPSSFAVSDEVSITPVSTPTSQPLFGAVSTQSVFDKPASAEGSIFGTFSAATTQPSILDNKSDTTAVSVFGTPITTASVFSKPATTTSSAFDTPPTTSSSSIFGTPSTTASIFGAPPTTSIFGTASTQNSLFGTPATSASTSDSVFGISTNKSVFGLSTTSAFGAPKTTTATFTFGTPTTSSIFGTPVTSSVFGTPATSSIFGAPTSNIFGTATKSSVFGTPTTSSVFAVPTTASSFGTPATAATAFGTPTTSSAFGTSSSIFGAPASSVFGTTNTSSAEFGAFGTTSAKPAFGQSSVGTGSIFDTPAPNSSGAFFGNAVTSSSNVFDKAATSSNFGTSTSSSPFVSSSAFGTSTTAASPFGATSNSFGSPQASSFNFAAAANAANVSSNGTGFGFNKPTFGFGNASGSTDANSFNFGGVNVGSSTTTSGGFGSGFGQNENPFARQSEEQKSPFGGGSIFGTPAVSSSSSVFGGSSPFNKSTPAFGGTATFGTSQGFGQQPSFGQGTFGAGGAYGSSAQPGPFSGGGQTVIQSGFGSPGSFQKPSGFGSAPAFGSTSPGGFGAPPAFGGSPTFGSANAFGGPSKVFGGGVATGAFGSPGQQNSTFANLANQPTLGFGSLAQQGQTPTSQPTGFSGGGSSFSSWR